MLARQTGSVDVVAGFALEFDMQALKVTVPTPDVPGPDGSADDDFVSGMGLWTGTCGCGGDGDGLDGHWDGSRYGGYIIYMG